MKICILLYIHCLVFYFDVQFGSMANTCLYLHGWKYCVAGADLIYTTVVWEGKKFNHPPGAGSVISYSMFPVMFLQVVCVSWLRLFILYRAFITIFLLFSFHKC